MQTEPKFQKKVWKTTGILIDGKMKSTILLPVESYYLVNKPTITCINPISNPKKPPINSRNLNSLLVI